MNCRSNGVVNDKIITWFILNVEKSAKLVLYNNCYAINLSTDVYDNTSSYYAIQRPWSSGQYRMKGENREER